MENVKAITTLRSGKTLEDPSKTQEMIEGSDSQQEEIEEVEDDSTPIQVKNNDKEKAKDDENSATYKSRAPFPTVLEVGREQKGNISRPKMKNSWICLAKSTSTFLS